MVPSPFSVFFHIFEYSPYSRRWALYLVPEKHIQKSKKPRSNTVHIKASLSPLLQKPALTVHLSNLRNKYLQITGIGLVACYSNGGEKILSIKFNRQKTGKRKCPDLFTPSSVLSLSPIMWQPIIMDYHRKLFLPPVCTNGLKPSH